MAKATKSNPPVAIVKLASFGDYEVRFGKGDKVQKLPLTGDKVSDLSKGEVPNAVLFVGKSGRTYAADLQRYPEQVLGILTFHGAKQKLADQYANLDSEDDMIEAVIELDNQLAEGKWFAERTGYSGMSVLMRAIMEVFEKTEDEARAFLKDLEPKEKMALRQSAELKPTIDRIESEKAKGTEKTTADLLAKLRNQTPIGE